jgi:hypothetical protein
MEGSLMARFMGFALVGLVLLLGLRFAQPVADAEEEDTQITVLAGEWKVTYTHDAVRVYAIGKDGKLSGTADDVKLTGQITRKGAALLLTFNEEDKLERLTLGADGRLFVEHYDPKGNFPDKKPTHMGIGIRQK